MRWDGVGLLGVARIVGGLANHKSVWDIGFVAVAAMAMAIVFTTSLPLQTPPRHEHCDGCATIIAISCPAHPRRA